MSVRITRASGLGKRYHLNIETGPLTAEQAVRLGRAMREIVPTVIFAGDREIEQLIAAERAKPTTRTTSIPWQRPREGREIALHDGLCYTLNRLGGDGWELGIRYDNNHGDHDAPIYHCTTDWDPNTAGVQWFQRKRDALDVAQSVATERRTELIREGAADPRWREPA